MKSLGVFFLILVSFISLIGCSRETNTTTTEVAITQIGTALEEIETHYKSNTSFDKNEVTIENQIDFQTSKAIQKIHLKIEDNNEVKVNIEAENYTGDTIMSSDEIYKIYKIEIPSSMYEESETDYLEKLMEMKIEENGKEFRFNFNEKFQLLDQNKIIELNQRKGIVYLHFEKNIKNLQRDIQALRKHNAGKEESINQLLHIMLEHPDIDIKSFAEKDLFEIYSYLLVANKELGNGELMIDFSSGIYIYNIINTLSNLHYLVKSPIINE